MKPTMSAEYRTRINIAQFTCTYIPFALAVTIALLAPELTTNLNRYRTIYTIWATTVLLMPTLSLWIFSASGPIAFNCWHLLWTFTYGAFLLHFYWAVFVIFGGIPETFAGMGALIAGMNFFLTAWWGFDVLLSWIAPPWIRWIRIERAGAHLFVFAIFVLTTLVLRPTPVTKVLGILLVTITALSLLVWFVVRAPATESSKS
jgi:hypothetical protein